MTPADFISALKPSAIASAATSRVPASFCIAQAAVESGWGESQLARQAKNLFGVKSTSDWTGEVLAMPTREFLNGSWTYQTALWRVYPDWLACMDDHARFLAQNPRYRAAFGLSGQEFARAIAKAGYATDPAYGTKLVQIIRTHDLESLDVKEPQMTNSSTKTAGFTFGGAGLVGLVTWLANGHPAPIPPDVAAVIAAAVVTGAHLGHNLIQSYLARKGLSDKE